MFAGVLDSPLDIYEKENKLPPFNLYNLSICFYFVFFCFCFCFFMGTSTWKFRSLPQNQARWVIAGLRSKNTNYE